MEDFEFQVASYSFGFGSSTSLKEMRPLALVSLVALSQVLVLSTVVHVLGFALAKENCERKSIAARV